MAHCTPADQVEELQERCYKYSQKALGFETCTSVALKKSHIHHGCQHKRASVV